MHNWVFRQIWSHAAHLSQTSICHQKGRCHSIAERPWKVGSSCLRSQCLLVHSSVVETCRHLTSASTFTGIVQNQSKAKHCRLSCEHLCSSQSSSIVRSPFGLRFLLFPSWLSFQLVITAHEHDSKNFTVLSILRTWIQTAREISVFTGLGMHRYWTNLVW